MRDRAKVWVLLGIVPILIPTLGSAYHSAVPNRNVPTHAPTTIALPSARGRAAWQPSRTPTALGRRGRQCHLCAGHTTRRIESRRALPRLKNTGRLPESAALLPHQIGSLFGVGSFITQRSPWLAGKLVQRVQLLSAGWVREELTASVLHAGPNRPYRWRPFDRVVNGERAAHLQVLGLLDYSNSWAYRSHATMPHARMDRLSAGFARYAAAVVRHFRGRISRWEIWNEPNIWTFWRPRPNPGDYAHLLTRAYRAIKRVDPHATVIMGGTSGVDLRFLRAVAARTHAFDAIAVHPYRILPEAQLLRQIAALRHFHRPLWFTEIGWAASNRCPLCTDEETQAGDLVRFYTLAAGAGVSHVFWYDLRDDVHAPSNPEGHFGLLRRDLAGKPAFSAFHFLSRALAGAKFVSADALDRSGVYALRFQSAADTVEVLWNTALAGRTILLPWTAPAVTHLSLDGDILRTATPRRGTIRVHLSARSDPIYLVTSPLTAVSSPGPLLRPVHHVTITRHRRKAHRPRPARRTRVRRQARPQRSAARNVRAARPTPGHPKQDRMRPASPVPERGRRMAPISTATAVPRPSSTTGPVRPTPSPSPTATTDARTPTPPVPTETAPAGP